MKRLFLIAALAALAACGQPAPSASSQTASAPSATPAPETDAVVLGSTRNLPDWLLVARQRDCAADAAPEDRCPLGEVHFNQRTITRTGDGFADIWIQARHGQPQLFEVADGTATTTIRFTLERVHYRFNCRTQEFVVVERLIMGPNEAVVARDEPRQIYRAPLRGSITQIIQPIACRGA